MLVTALRTAWSSDPPGPVAPGGVPTTGPQLVRRTLRRQRGRLAAGIGFISLWQVCEALVPVLIGLAVDRAVATGSVVATLGWGLALCVHFAVLSYAYRFGARIGNVSAQQEVHRLRGEVARHVLSPRGVRGDRLPGEVLSLATSDAEEVGQLLRWVALSTASLLGLLVTAVALLWIDVPVAVLVLVGVPVVLLATRLVAPRIERSSADQQAAVARAAGVATDLVQGLRPLKGVRAEAAGLLRYRSASQRAARASVRVAATEGALYGVTALLSGLLLAAVVLLAGLRAVDGALSIGELVAVVGLAQFLAEPLEMLTALAAMTARSRASAERVTAFLATAPLLPAGSVDTVPGGPDGAPPVLVLEQVEAGPLRGLDLVPAPGGLTAVVADDPAVVATLVRLLRGEEAPTAGRVALGGVPLAELAPGALHAALLVEGAHPDLLEGTLRTNVDLHDRLDDTALAAVRDASAVDDVVALDPAGWEQPVTTGGTTWSGGQRQRTGLARTLAAAPPVLVLADPTTAVDAVTEARIAAGLRAHRRACRGTTLLLTSSPALLAVADHVVHVVDGRVARAGRHDALLGDPAYAEAVTR